MTFGKFTKQSDIHKTVIRVFGSIGQAARAIGFSKNMIYGWMSDEPVHPQSIKRLTRNLDIVEADLKEIREKLIPSPKE